MVIEKQVWYTFDFPEDEIDRIVDLMREDYDERKAIREIEDVVSGWDDCDYYAWDRDETEKVVEEIKRRVGGVQLSMELE